MLIVKTLVSIDKGIVLDYGCVSNDNVYWWICDKNYQQYLQLIWVVCVLI